MSAFLCAVLALAAESDLSPAPTPPEASAVSGDTLGGARAAFDYGNYAAAALELERLALGRSLERTADQIEAFRLLGLAHFFLGQSDEARRAFLKLLSLDPDFQMDPLYVPPQAIAAFEDVRKQNQALLEPIRQRRRATQEALAQEEVARQQLLAQGSRGEPTTVVRERVDRPSVALALLPFGIGQFQNGHRALGLGLAAVEALALGTSIGSYLWIEGKREASGYYAAADYPVAHTLEVVQVASGAGFGALWILGAVDALLRLRPATVVEEGSGPLSPGPALNLKLSPSPRGISGALGLSF